MARAKAFYETLLQEKLELMELRPVQYALFSVEDRFNCGALAQGEGYEPSAQGVTVYLDGGEDLESRLARAQKAGGTAIMPKTYLGKEAGHIGLFLDSEANRIGLQSP
jgi:hypothetical protein